MKKRSLTNFLLISALMLGGATTFVSCKDYDSDAAYDLNDQWNKKFADIVEDQEQKLKDINTKLEQIKQCNCNDEAIIALINKQIKENQETIAAIKDIANSAIDDLLNDNNRLNDAISKTESVSKLLKEIYGENGDGGMKKSLEDLEDSFKNAKAAWTEKSAALSDSVKWALTLAQEDSIRLDKMKNDVENNTTDINQLKKDYNKLNNVTIPELSNDLNQAKTDIITAQNTANDALKKAQDLDKELKDSINNAKEAVLKEVSEKYATKEELDNYVTLETIKDYYTATQIDNKLENIEKDYKALIAILDDAFNKLVTGVIMQGSESPLTGYVSTPFGVSVNVLGAYYGTSADNFSLGGEMFRGGTVISDTDANAGLIFINVNPVNVNPSGIDFKLVDSQGNEAPFKLTPVNTDRVLKFGGTRAVSANANGFYALQVKLDEDKIKAAQTWTSADASELKDAAKNVLGKLRHPKTNSLNVGDIVSAIEGTFNNRLTRYAVKATWKYKNSKGEEVVKSTVSELNLAATAIKPLSYEFLKDGVDIDLPTIPSLEEKLNLVSYKFNWTPIEGMEDMKTSVTMEVPDADNIEINGKITPTAEILGRDDVTIIENADGSQTVDLSGLNVKIGDIDLGDNVHVTIGKKTETYEVTVPMDDFNKIIDNINSQVGNMVGSVNDMIDRVNGWTETIDGQVINRVNSYIKRFENLLKHSNSLLQPTMLYTAQSGAWNQLPNVESAAAYLKLNGGEASTVFIATSYTAELLAPAYKKYVHVTSMPAGATVTGANLNKVIDGNVYKIGFKANKPGTYGITYEAADYAGKTVKKTFYVKVVE